MPISFFDISDDDGWEPLPVNPADATFYWNDGGFMTAAPVDVTATFDGAMWRSTKVEAPFGLRGRRIRPDFVVPKRHHNMRQLMIIMSGEMEVEYGENEDQTARLESGGFWVGEAGVPYRITAGPKGVAYLECWPENMSLLETYWHDDSHWVRK